jgi:general secretion pathway protein C
MQDKSLSHQAALRQRTAQMEQHLRHTFAFLQRVSLARWQLLIILILVVWLGHSLAKIVWLIIPEPTIPAATVTRVVSTNSGVSSGETINLSQVKELSPFGEIPTEQEPVAQTPVASSTNGIENNATDTQLALTLRGVLSSNDESAARAIIDAGQRADVYAIGDTLPVGNNVTLAKVLDLRVIINNNGSYESVWMYKDDPSMKLRSSNDSFPASPAYDRRDNAQQRPSPASVMPPNTSPQFTSPTSDPVAQAAQSLADVVAMSIHRENGEVVGYKIRPGRNADVFHSLGLQTEDIVTAVNGVSLSSPGKVMEIYKNMGSATSATLEIRRAGGTVNLDVMLK